MSDNSVDSSPGGLRTVSDLILTPPNDIAKKKRKPLSEIQRIIGIVCKEVAQEARNSRRFTPAQDECFTTGDSILDGCLGGGVRTGMVWELCGERCAS